MRDEREKWVSGYHGADSMRDKAHRFLGKGFAEGGEVPESMSSPARTKMRPFAEGGRAGGGAMRRGGHHKHSGLSVQSVSEAERMKRGGRNKHRYGVGGAAIGASLGIPAAAALGELDFMKQHPGVHNAIRAILPGALGGLGALTSPFKKGGSTHRRKHHADGGHAAGGNMRHGGHHKHRYAEGGNVYEREMVGECAERAPSRGAMKRGGHHKPKFGWGGSLVGKGVGAGLGAMGGSFLGPIGAVGGGALGEAVGSRLGDKYLPFKRGGHPKRHRAEGGEMTSGNSRRRYAAGGVGKIRHGQATASGHPKGSKRIIRNDLF
jgi:hypothetical protein